MLPWGSNGKIFGRGHLHGCGAVQPQSHAVQVSPRMNAEILFFNPRLSAFICVLFNFMIVVALSACAAAAPTPAPITLSPGKYSALGANPKPAQPTQSDIAGLQAAQNGTLQQPVMVEFYSDT